LHKTGRFLTEIKTNTKVTASDSDKFIFTLKVEAQTRVLAA
jgi:hypothetical protein